MNATADWPQWVDPKHAEDIPTRHLPDVVVKQPFLLGIDSRTAIDNPRHGGCWAALNIDGRFNPELTEDEKAYILGVVKWALDGLPGKPSP